GIPEGITMQLDPGLNLDSFDLTPGARQIAECLQVYGAVLVDYCDGATFYAEGLQGENDPRSWDGLLSPDGVMGIGFEHFRFLKPEQRIYKGSHPAYHNGISRKFYNYLIETKSVPQSIKSHRKPERV
ncbi:MAG: hypothetical protein JXR97_02530, partial [Planctomycetes bacterium]|nr:hypothetical protein [Planctomycetota bacterium]